MGYGASRYRLAFCESPWREVLRDYSPGALCCPVTLLIIVAAVITGCVSLGRAADESKPASSAPSLKAAMVPVVRSIDPEPRLTLAATSIVRVMRLTPTRSG